MDDLLNIIVAVGALGTAAFGIVEGLKWTPLGTIGFGAILSALGDIKQTLEQAYGPNYQKLLRAQYRGDQQALARTLRQGVRLGLTPATARAVADEIKVVSPEDLLEAANYVDNQGQPQRPSSNDDQEQRKALNIFGRMEMAVDARIDAALITSTARYAGAMRVAASVVAVGISLVVANQLDVSYLKAFLIGIAAIPVAPITKDIVSALQAAGKTLGRGK